MDAFLPQDQTDACPIHLIYPGGFDAWRGAQDDRISAWIDATGFKAKPGRHLLLPDDEGGIRGVLAIAKPEDRLWGLSGLPSTLPTGAYKLAETTDLDTTQCAIGWALGAYDFDRYRSSEETNDDRSALVIPETADAPLVDRTVQAVTLVRDLVNTPAADLGPPELAERAADLAAEYKADYRQVVGEALLDENYPMIHAVGRAAAKPPRLIDIGWGEPDAPKVTLVGKGVCFDTGGLDLKPASAMRLMKKDMGGAATVLGLARMIMDAGLGVRLRVLIPAVENNVSGGAFRPGDVLSSRKGLSVEIGNTDAEGRLVLADALAEGDSEAPELMIDCATLTGAARVALGPDLPAMFTDDDALAAALADRAADYQDPIWRLPLHPGYRELLDSKIADLNNAPDSPFAGAVTAALFLQRFVEQAKAWVHFDLFAWNAKARPGRPIGGEAMAMRALYHELAARYPG